MFQKIIKKNFVIIIYCKILKLKYNVDNGNEILDLCIETYNIIQHIIKIHFFP